MNNKIQNDFYHNLAKNIKQQRKIMKKQLEQEEAEFSALRARLARLRMWTELECVDGCIRLKRTNTI